MIGWFGGLFWPYAYWDFVDYTFWPYAYDAFWPYAYDDLYDGVGSSLIVWTPVPRAQQALPRRVTGDQLLTTSVNWFWQQIN